MPEQVIKGPVLPVLLERGGVDRRPMISDNGWIIHYDMEAAKFMGKKQFKERSPGTASGPGVLLLERVYPGDNIDSGSEREKIIAWRRRILRNISSSSILGRRENGETEE